MSDRIITHLNEVSSNSDWNEDDSDNEEDSYCEMSDIEEY